MDTRTSRPSSHASCTTRDQASLACTNRSKIRTAHPLLLGHGTCLPPMCSEPIGPQPRTRPCKQSGSNRTGFPSGPPTSPASNALSLEKCLQHQTKRSEMKFRTTLLQHRNKSDCNKTKLATIRDATLIKY